MKSLHSRHHWIPVALVAGAALLTLTEVSGQSPNAAAVFAGRPALAGANGGLGAQAGLPQGGIGLQGNDGAQVALRRPRIVEEPANMPQGSLDEPPAVVAADAGNVTRSPEMEIATAGDARSQRAAQRNAERAVTGASPVDARDARAVAR